jgi:hypothetical protein
MEVFFDFDFITEEVEDISVNNLIISKDEIINSLNAIDEVIAWLNKSIYINCLSNAYLVITDCPAETVEFVEVNHSSCKLHVQLNILSLITDYWKEPLYRKIIFKREWQSISLTTYIQFFLLHEIGHIIDSQLTTPNIKNRIDKFESYILKNRFEYDNLDIEFGIENRTKLTPAKYDLLQKKYRRIPQEKKADLIAIQLLKEITECRDTKED